MRIPFQDPYPGRCRNRREVGEQTLRCLDYENVPHVCSFPKPNQQMKGGWNQYQPAPPRPWVKPS